MCGIAEASIAMTLLSGVSQFMTQQQQAADVQASGIAQQQQAEYEAAIERNNALRAEYLADDAIERGKSDEREERLRGRLLIGAMRAQLAGSGQVIDDGSAGDLIIDQSETNELNARTVRNNAAREAQEFRIQASNKASSAELTSLAGTHARQRADRQARFQSRNSFGTLLSTGGTVASKWYQLDQKGAF